MRNAFVDTLCDLAANDKNIYLLVGDLGFGVLKKFSDAYPERFINVGIAEQNLSAVAAGLALEGNTVFTYSISNFPTFRCLEQVRNCISYHKANVKIVSIGAGLSYGTLGMTHHATEDLSVMRAIPNMTIFSPADVYESVAVTTAACKIDTPCYIRLGKGREPLIHQHKLENYEIDKAIKIFDGDDCAIFSTGSISNEALNAARRLNAEGIGTAFFTFPTVKPIDIDVIERYAKKCAMIVTIEENNVVGGFGSAVAEIVSELKGEKAFLKRVGINDEFTNNVGSHDYLKDYYNLKEDYIFAMIYNEFLVNPSQGGVDNQHIAINGHFWDSREIENLRSTIIDSLKALKNDYGAIAVKAEFEAEGSRKDELIMLHDIIKNVGGLGLIIKIGGCEAVHDLDQCKLLSADGVMAPMIETPFAMKKFKKAFYRVYGESSDVERIINAETKTCLNYFDDILKEGKNFLTGVTVGRSDLSASMGIERKDIESEPVFKATKEFAVKAKTENLTTNFGGNIGVESVPFIVKMTPYIDRFETRKIVLAKSSDERFLKKAIVSALKFELLYLKFKSVYYTSMATEDIERVKRLQRQVALSD